MLKHTETTTLRGNVLRYTAPGFIVSAVRIDGNDPRPYGGNIRTDWKVSCADNRVRRVYAMAYGNAASMFVVIDGNDVFLDIDAETVLERARRADAAPHRYIA